MANKDNNAIDSDVMSRHYDIGVYGWWGHENFGGCLTYFALERTLKNMGNSVLMIQEAKGLPGRYIIPDDCIAMKHAKANYNCSPQLDFTELSRFNSICDKFIVGGDQLWNYHIHFVKEDCFLNFVNDDKIKISYSTSFGAKNHTPPPEHLARVAPLLRRFDSISVREDYAVDIAKNTYLASATEIIDAVFLPDVKEYTEVAKTADCILPKKYLAAFILNPTEDKRRQIEIIAKKLDLDILMIPDAAAGHHGEFNRIFAGMKILSPLSVANFLKAYQDSSYVITDSFHGTCMSYIFKKAFNVYYNEARGADRFISLMKILDLSSRRIYEWQTENELALNENVGSGIKWYTADTNVKAAKKFAMKWLKAALEGKKSEKKYPSEIHNPALQEMQSNPDFIKIRILATLLRDYGIKHVVLSPGGRDVPIIRMFEYNEGSFTLHRVVDERSAAYYALGLAAQLKAPVACVCTSGTAASNYLPAVTEAFYTGIPMIVITADRYEAYLNHGEDQTIPQKNIYNGVVKKSISLPEGSGYLPEYQTRRDISTAILEATHNGWGPVHINVPVNNISIGASVDRSHWSLLSHIYPHILRCGFGNGNTDMYKWVDALKKSTRVMVVYGQSPAPSTEESKIIDEFASRYNCVILTDPLSNLSSDYAVDSFNLLNAINQEEFDKTLSPDIVITVGGKRLMNDPLTFKLRGAKNVRHWSVTPDGQIKDFYFKLSSVLECTAEQFFRFFNYAAADTKNNGEYLNAWRQARDAHPARPIGGFNSHYIQSKFIPRLPSGATLHLGVGESFFSVRRYTIQPGVEVFCNMGTNGIDGCTSTFMGACAVEKNRPCYLLIGDLSFFYDMNSLWNKQPNKNAKILMVNNNGSGLLRGHNLKAVSSVHNTSAEGWVRSTGFEYICARNQGEFDEKLNYFMSDKSEKPLFFEVFCD